MLDNGGELNLSGLHSRNADTDVPMESIGQELSKERQRRGMKLSDVWLMLKIRPDFLAAIEEGRFEALPGRVYAIGYVRSYAACLSLDAERLVERLKVEIAARDPAKDDPAIDLLPQPERRLPQGGKVIAGMLVAALIYTGYHALSFAGRAADPPVLPVPERLAAEAGLMQKPIAEPPLSLVEQKASTLSPGRMLPMPTEIAVTQPVAGPEELPPRVQAQLPPGRRYGARNTNSRITLRVHRPTRVAVQGARNRTFIDRALAAGDTYRVPNMVGLRLTAPDSGAVELILDGSSVGFVGEDGVIARRLSLNPQNIIARQQRG